MEIEIGWKLMITICWTVFCVCFAIFAYAVQKYKKN